MTSLNIILESNESILSDLLISKDQKISTKKSYSKYKIWNNFHENSDKTKVICNLYDQSYLKSSSSIVINMKNYFKRQHNKEFIEILQKQLIRNNDLNNNQKIINIQEKNNDIDKYITEEEIEEEIFNIVQ